MKNIIYHVYDIESITNNIICLILFTGSIANNDYLPVQRVTAGAITIFIPETARKSPTNFILSAVEERSACPKLVKGK